MTHSFQTEAEKIENARRYHAMLYGVSKQGGRRFKRKVFSSREEALDRVRWYIQPNLG